jgi:hypothetical protein
MRREEIASLRQRIRANTIINDRGCWIWNLQKQLNQ